MRLAVRNQAGAVDLINLSGPQVREVQNLPIVECVLAMGYRAMTLTGREFPENVNAITLIGNGFRDLGVPPLMGRGLTPSDSSEGQEPQPVTVVSYKFWQEHLSGDPAAVGKTVELDHQRYTIVGVAAPRFRWYSADVYLPLKTTQSPEDLLMVDFRLKPGVTKQTANGALEPLLRRYAHDAPKRYPERFKVQVEGLNEWVVRDMSTTLFLLQGAVALLLAIGCGNVSILLLARGTARQHELAVRAAVGAGRRRVVRQLLTEALLLAAVGAALGVAMSYGILAWIRLLLPRWAFAPEVVIRIHFPELLFSVAVALATAVLFGLWPALRISQTRPNEMLTSTRRVAGSARGRRAHNVLVGGQIALTLLMLAAAGAATEGFVRLMHTPLGFDPHDVMVLAIPLRENTYSAWRARASYIEALRSKVNETPGVAMAAIASNAVPPRNGWYQHFEIMGRTAKQLPWASINMVSPQYFPALRIPLIVGRVWDEAETRGAANVAVINRTLAQRYFPNGGAIGHGVKLPDLEDRPPRMLATPNLADTWLSIIGVVADARNDGLHDPVTAAIYLPYTLDITPFTQIVVKTQGASYAPGSCGASETRGGGSRPADLRSAGTRDLDFGRA